MILPGRLGAADPQASRVMVAMELGKVPARDGLRLCMVPAAPTFPLLPPLDYARFRTLGRSS